jgi:hypothetical protein
MIIKEGEFFNFFFFKGTIITWFVFIIIITIITFFEKNENSIF